MPRLGILTMNPAPGSVQAPRPADAAADPKRPPASNKFNINILRRGIQLDSAVYVSLLQQCGNTKALSDGKRVHAHMIECGCDRDPFLANNLLQMYTKCGHLDEARALFDTMEERCKFSWTMMIAGFTQNGHCKEAIQLFREMELEGVKPDGVTLTSVVGAYAGGAAQSLKDCKEIHGRIASCGFEHDVFLANTLINMYGKCRSVRDAKSVFDKMPRRNVVSWNALFTAYAQNGHDSLVLELYRSMDLKGTKPTHVTFLSVLNACSNLGALAEARAVHACVIANRLESDVVVGNTLINAYGKSGSLEEARRVFDRMPKRDVVSWNAMLGAYAQQGHSHQVLELYGKIDSKPNRVTFITVLGACSHSEAFAEGKAIHARIAGMPELYSDIAVRTALIGMHGRCGNLDHARALFDETRNKDVCSWNAMLAAYAQHGHLDKVVVLFREMDLEGVSPDGISLITLLFSCSHAGLLHEAWSYFVFMQQDRGTSPEVEHYRCIMDLLARAGRVRDVEDLIDNMPFEADALAWRILLAACNSVKDVDRGARAAKHVVEIETRPKSAPYVLLSNMYAGEENGQESRFP